MNPQENQIRLGTCPHTMQSTLQIYTQGEWLCLHRDSRQEEINEIKQYLKEHQNPTKQETKRNLKDQGFLPIDA